MARLRDPNYYFPIVYSDDGYDRLMTDDTVISYTFTPSEIEAIALALDEQDEYLSTKDGRTMNIQKIKLSLIKAPAWDSRLPKTGAAAKQETIDIGELADSLKASGQLQPIIVEGPDADGMYERVIGGRRCAAAAAAGWDEITADVREPSDASTKIVDNIIENVKRKNLTSFEEARACVQLRDLKLSGEEVGKKLGFSKQKVSNLAVSFAGLPAPILADWERDVPAVNVQFLRELANPKKYPTDDSKVEAWEARKAALEAAENEDKPKRKKKGDDEGKGTSGYSLVQKNMGAALAFLKSKKAPAKIGGTSKWAATLLDYVMGQRKTPPEGMSFESDDEEDDGE